jgi:hypothetical protein
MRATVVTVAAGIVASERELSAALPEAAVL